MKKSLFVVALFSLVLLSSAEAQILRLTGATAGEVSNVDLPDGTKIKWTEFFKSAASFVSVGRSDIEGPLMPREKLSYTDVFYIADGSAVFVDGEHRQLRVHKGDIFLLPRGIEIEGRDFKHYRHFAASFETQPAGHSSGPTEMRVLRPKKLKEGDFSVAGTSMRHVYYEGTGGVVVRAWQSAQADIATQYNASSWSELFFVVSGNGTLTEQGKAEEKLAPGDVFFVPKGAVFKFTGHHLRKLAIVFDQTPATASH